MQSKPGNVTLESLLDAPGFTPPSPIKDGSMSNQDCINSSTCNVSVDDNTIEDVINSRSMMYDICLELIYFLKQQDVNGYLLYPTAVSKNNSVSKPIHTLLDIETNLLSSKYNSVKDLYNDVINMLNIKMELYRNELFRYQEVSRLYTIAEDWMNSLPTKYLIKIEPTDKDNLVPTVTENHCETSISAEKTLAILNPDNNGILSKTERIRSIGEEAGLLTNGTFLLPDGGYREDRRNKVIPYSYMNYGPYYTFGPTYDSGASHCTVESNQLLLGTSWIPGRLKYVLGQYYSDILDDINISDELINDIVQQTGDQQLGEILLNMQADQNFYQQMSDDLEQILPDSNTSEDCVFSMCLANALTKDLLTKNNEDTTKKVKETSDAECGFQSTGENTVNNCDLDLPEEEYLIRNTNNSNDELLQKSAEELRALYCAQYLRLGEISSDKCSIQPSSIESDRAFKLVRRLIDLVKQTKPIDLIHPYSVRCAMNINPYEYDLPNDDEQLDRNRLSPRLNLADQSDPKAQDSCEVVE